MQGNSIDKLYMIYGKNNVVTSDIEKWDADDNTEVLNVKAGNKKVVCINGKIVQTKGKFAEDLNGKLLILDKDKYYYRILNLKNGKHIDVAKSTYCTLRNGYFVARINKRLGIFNSKFELVHDINFIKDKKSLVIRYLRNGFASFAKNRGRNNYKRTYTEYTAIRFEFRDVFRDIIFNTLTGKIDIDSRENFYKKRLNIGFSVVRDIVNDNVVTSLIDDTGKVLESGISDDYIEVTESDGFARIFGIDLKTKKTRQTEFNVVYNRK